ncbi:MAG: MFS transporter [Spirosomataceae bacterium]
MPRKELILLLLLACVNFTHIMDFMIMMPLGPQLMRSFNVSPQQFGWMVSAYSFSAGFSGFLASFFVDRFDRKRVLQTAYSGLVIATWACAFAPTYELLTAARIIAGIFGGVLGSQVMSIVGDTIPYERRGRGMAVIQAAFSLAAVAGVPFGLWLASQLSWHAPFLFVGCLGLVNSLLIQFFVPPLTTHLQQLDHKPHPLDVIRSIASQPNQQRALVLTGLMMIGHFSIIPFISPYLVTNAHFSEKDIYLIYLVGGALTIISSPLIGKLADQYGKYRLFAICASLSLTTTFAITNLPAVELPLVLVVSGFFFIFSGGRVITSQAMLSSVVLPQNRGGFMSINTAVMQLSSATGSFVAGMIVQKGSDGLLHHYPYVGYMAIIAMICAIIVARKIKPVGQDAV